MNKGLGGHSIYEMHIGTFTNEGTFAAAAEKLPHIAGLGFSCIELMPTTEYGGSWGYNPRACMSIHPHYGNPDEFRKFIDQAHALGVAVVVSINALVDSASLVRPDAVENDHTKTNLICSHVSCTDDD